MSTDGLEDNGEFDPEKSKGPVYIKVQRRDLLPATLEAYNLPWEWCLDDPGYILIKAFVDEELQAELFAHTNRILEMDDAPQFDGEDDPSSVQDLLSDRDGGYDPPVCDELGRLLSVDITLKPSALKQSVDGFRVNPSHRESSGRQVNVVGSQITGFGKAVLYRARDDADELESQFSWIHLDSEVRSLDEFLRFASNVPKLADEDRALVLALLKRTRLQPGRWDMPSDVQRCVGVNPTASDGITEEKSAIFLRFPYYSIQKAKGPAQSRTGAGKHPLSLLQYFYNLESTGKRDLDQVIRKVGLFQQADIVHVSQLWAVIVNFRFLITCAPMPLTDSASPSLEILNPELPKSSPSASIISVVDHRRRVFFFPMEQCKTYFGMRRNVSEHCLPPDFQDRGYDFQLLSDDNAVIKAEDWANLTTSHSSTILRVHVQILSSASKRSAKKQGFKLFGGSKKHKYSKAVPEYSKAGYDTKAQMRPVPPPSGVVVNEEPNTAPRIYFEPDMIHSASSTANQANQGPKGERVKTGKAQGVDEFLPHLPEKTQGLIMDFPPVFTWPVGRRQATEGTPRSTCLDTSTATNSPSPGTGSPNKHETIEHVLSHVHKQLLEDGTKGHAETCAKGTTSSYFEVDKLVKQQWSASLSTLTATVEQNRDTSSLSPWGIQLQQVVGGLCRLFNFFVPLAYPCAVGDKFWGAIHDLLTVIPQICDISMMLALSTRTRGHRRTQAYFSADLRAPEYADLRDEMDVGLVTDDMAYCSKCDAGQQYPTRPAALDHVFACHVATPPTRKPELSAESWWVMDFAQYLSFSCRKDGQQILRQLSDHLASLEVMASQIQHGVSVNGKFDEDTYRIPSSLVNAFLDIIMTVSVAADVAKSVYMSRQAYTSPDPIPSFLSPFDSRRLANFGADAESCMEDALKDIALMTYTDEASDIVTYEAVSPSLLLALVIGDTYPCKVAGSRRVKLVQIYRDYILTLQFKASQHAHRRLLQDIYLVREELLIIQRISDEQRRALGNYRNVLRPSSFRITTESRISSFQLEEARLNELISQVDADLAVIDGLFERLDSLAAQTLNGVEVKQEDQGKAILVFTIVTIVFMPLSFVSSYFGMNTADIRDTGRSQALFWAVSLPLTTVIILLTLFVAFNAEQIRAALDVLLGYGRMPIRTAARQASPSRDLEKYSGSSTDVKWWEKKRRSRRHSVGYYSDL